MIAQCTLKTGVTTTGVGLHTGEKVRLGLRPAPPDTGIVFRRTDIEGAADIPATADAVRDTRMSSCLIADSPAGEIRVSTVEHLMSALCGLGVDNAYVDVSAAEIPILDGSAASFVYLIQSAGLVPQTAPRRFIRLRKAVEVREGEGSAAKWARLEPHLGFKLAFSIEFSHPAVDKTGQRSEFDFSESAYTKEIARARTFGFTRDVETLRASGLALGGSLDNAIVMDEFRVLNADGLRYADEFVKHKMLDAIGDLYLAGHPLLGAYTAHKSGHALNNRLVRALLADTQAWDLFSFTDEATAPAYLRPALGLGAAW